MKLVGTVYARDRKVNTVIIISNISILTYDRYICITKTSCLNLKITPLEIPTINNYGHTSIQTVYKTGNRVTQHTDIIEYEPDVCGFVLDNLILHSKP